MTSRTYTLTFEGITLDTTNLRMEKRGGKEVIDFFYLDENFTIKDDDITDVSSLRAAIEKSPECKIISTEGDRTTLEVKLDLYDVAPEPPKQPMKLVDDLADEFGADNLWYLYRTIYKYTDCGPSVGFLISNLPADHPARPRYGDKPKADDPIWLYCDDLGKLGTLEEMKANGQAVVGVSVSSIVEGSDAEVPGDTLHGEATTEDFWKLVESVNEEACFLWERDNSKWYCLKSPDDEPWSFHETWGEIKWDTDEDDMPPPEVVEAVKKFIEDGGNITWEENWGTQTHKYDEYFPLPGAEGWTVCEYVNDACY